MKNLFRIIFLACFSVAVASDRESTPTQAADCKVSSFGDSSSANVQGSLPKRGLAPVFMRKCRETYPGVHQYKQRGLCYMMFGFQSAVGTLSGKKK